VLLHLPAGAEGVRVPHPHHALHASIGAVHEPGVTSPGWGHLPLSAANRPASPLPARQPTHQPTPQHRITFHALDATPSDDALVHARSLGDSKGAWRLRDSTCTPHRRRCVGKEATPRCANLVAPPRGPVFT
jgi:hypothetical protein